VGTKRARGGSSQFEQDAAIDLSPHDREPILAESPDSHREFKMCKIDGANPLTPASEGPNGRPLLDKDVMMQSGDYVGYNKCLDGQQTPELPRPLSITDQILDAASKVDEGVGAEDFCKYATKYDGGEVEPSSPYNGAANAQSCSTTDAVVSPGALSPQAPSTLPRSRVADHGVPKCGHLMGTLEGANGDYSVHPDQLGKGNFGTVSTSSVNSLKLYGSMSIATEPCGVQVCRGNVVSSGRAVAVKAVQRSSHAQATNEVTCLKALRGQPHVIQLLDVVTSPIRETFIVMEQASRDLFSLVEQDGPLPEHRAAPLMRQVLAGVSACHSAGIAHRDLKIDNILIFEPEGLVKLCDFDLACFFDRANTPETRGGSKSYAAPELFDCVLPPAYDDRVADAWSCGVIWFVLTVGHFPWEMATVNSPMFVQHLQGAYPWPSDSSPVDLAMRELLHIEISKRSTILKAAKHVEHTL